MDSLIEMRSLSKTKNDISKYQGNIIANLFSIMNSMLLQNYQFQNIMIVILIIIFNYQLIMLMKNLVLVIHIWILL